ncbi:MAG: hypothetical protein J2P48_15075 [Alphaproteobacteria bacterium]|nr:hypothetical protein [Alphaproteobacteria bacterium]
MLVTKMRHQSARQNVFGATLARFVEKRRRGGRPRLGGLRRMPLLDRLAPQQPAKTPDPVSVAVLAIDRVGPAAVRACASGLEVCVAAPDEATAAVLRAALAQTARHRSTDRLVRIVVD